MDHDEQGVVGKGAEEIGSADDHPPGAIFKQPCQDALKENEAEYGKDGILVLSDELSYFGVVLQDLFGAEAMWFLLVGVHKISSFGHRSIIWCFRRR
jgi:hypothetical protein